MSDSDSERAIYWYYQVNGKQEGPVLIGRLRQCARSGRLQANDLVRKGSTGEWAPATTFSEISVLIEEQLQAKTAVTGPLNSALPTLHLNVSKGPSIFERFSDFLFEVKWKVADQFVSIRRIASYLAISVVITTCLVSGAYFGLQSRFFDWSTPVDPLIVYESVWDELKTHRQSQSEGAVWAEFTDRSRSQITSVLTRLKTTASSSNREDQFLLWAGRDCLRVMLEDARTEPSAAELQFAEHIENVIRLRAGESVYGNERNPWVGQNRENPLAAPSDRIATIASILLTATNLVLIGWFVLRYLIGRSTGQAKPASDS